MNLCERLNSKGDKMYYYYDLGRGKNQRASTGVFTYVKPKDNIQRMHNTRALELLETKKSETQLDLQSTGSSFIPSHKFKANFVDYYEEYVKKNRRYGNRHLGLRWATY